MTGHLVVSGCGPIGADPFLRTNPPQGITGTLGDPLDNAITFPFEHLNFPAQGHQLLQLVFGQLAHIGYTHHNLPHGVIIVV